MRSDGVSGRERLAGSLGLVRAIPGGGTGLYDTVLAATRRVRAGWDPTRVNTVVVMTDGRNEDDRGVSLDGLLATLRHEQDPRRPVPVIVIALGPDIDAAALRVITRATGGALYPIRDPRLIERVFRDALGRRR
jgi:Mg-chelatase subunit ChlD